MSSAPTPGKNDVRREGRANWQFALPPSMRPFGKTRQTAICPTLFRGVTDDVLATSSDRLADRLE
jgi:hypothetical protein